VRTANRFAGFFTQIAYIVGTIVTLGALFGIVKVLYAPDAPLVGPLAQK
jgi:hypothetical protein